ncbi:MAG: DUF6428 family protein [Ferruginibacter sp.]
MLLSEIKHHLKTAEAVNFKLPDGSFVPPNFHVTEVGKVSKHFIDCGGKERFEKKANFQLWNADDHDHRLKPQKLLHILELSEKVLGQEDLSIEVEYQTATIGKYALEYDGLNFQLIPLHTDCLAKENCGIPGAVVSASQQPVEASCCTPGGSCC